MLADVRGNRLAKLRSRVVEDPLNQVVAVLVAGNVNERDTSPVRTALADAVEVPAQKLGASNLEALLNNLGGKLISAVLGSVANDVVHGAALVRRSPMLANVLDAPVAKLPMGHNVNVGKDLFDAGALFDG